MNMRIRNTDPIAAAMNEPTAQELAQALKQALEQAQYEAEHDGDFDWNAAAILATEPMQAIARRLLDDQMADLITALDRRNIHSAGDLFTYEKAIARESIARGKPWGYTDISR